MTVSLLCGLFDTPLAGREPEIDRIEELVRSVQSGSRFVVMSGEAGIGKTALWRWVLQRLREAGYRTMVTRAVEEELTGPMLGLVDLFDGIDAPGVLSDVLDLFERGRCVLAALQELSSKGPVLVAIDDVQWLDPVSAGALRYSFRRVEKEPILVLATERSDPSVSADDRTIPPGRREEIVLGPLSLEATREVVAAIIDLIPRPALERIHELSGGNPMYAVELARAVHLFDDRLVASVPPTLRMVVSNRIADIDADVLVLLRVAAAIGPSPVATIERAVESREVSRLVGIAAAQGLLVVDDDLIVRFTHPLLASAVLAGVNPVERLALHARLAEVVNDPDARARHLVLSCAEPDGAAAGELEVAAQRAARRGASALAADLASHCVRITPTDEIARRIRRQFIAILHRAGAGERLRALAECDALVALLPPGPARAEAISMRVGIDFAGGDRFLEQALDEVGDDELLRGRILELRGWMAVTYRAELVKGLELGEEALAIAERLGDPTLEMLAASSVATAGLMLGRPRPGLMERALRLSEARGGPQLGRWPQGVHGRLCLWCGQLDEARPILEGMYDVCRRSGMEFQRPYRLLDLVDLELASGNLVAAADLAADGIEAATDAGNDQAAAWLGYPGGLVNAHLGRAERARQAATILQSRGNEHDGRTRMVMAHHLLGVLALAAGQPARALADLEPALGMIRQIGLRLPSVVPVLPDCIEATALAGDVDSCAELAAELDRQAAAVEQPWVTASARRGVGLVALAEGGAGAAEILAESAETFHQLGYRLEAARATLLRGRALRRAGLRNASADVLTEVRDEFRAMSAAPWEAQADAELARVAPVRDTADLTPTESRIVALVLAGRRNREIAGELFISVATVEGHLTRIYRKVHVRSRTELTRAVRADAFGG